MRSSEFESVCMVTSRQADRPRKGDIVETSVRPSVRPSERLTSLLCNPLAKTNHIWHMDTPAGGKGDPDEFDLICILIRSCGHQGQKSTLASVHFTI